MWAGDLLGRRGKVRGKLHTDVEDSYFFFLEHFTRFGDPEHYHDI